MSRGDREAVSGNLSRSMRENYETLGVESVRYYFYSNHHYLYYTPYVLVLYPSWSYISQPPFSRRSTMHLAVAQLVCLKIVRIHVLLMRSTVGGKTLVNTQLCLRRFWTWQQVSNLK